MDPPPLEDLAFEPTCTDTELLLMEVKSEIKQGFDNLSAKLLLEIKDMLLNGNSLPNFDSAPNGDSPPFMIGLKPAETGVMPTEPDHNCFQPAYHNDVTSPVSPKSADNLSKQPEPQVSVDHHPSAPSDEPSTPGSPSHIPLKKKSREWRKAMTAVVVQNDNSLRQQLVNLAQDVRQRSSQHEASQQRFLYRAVHTNAFQGTCMLFIVTNAMWMGYESENRKASETGWRRAIGMGFNIWFMVELVFKMIALRTGFILGPDVSWNLLDLFLVIVSLPEFVSAGMNMSYVRILRLARLSRSLRLLRLLKFFRSLREILMTVFHTMGSLFWSFIAILLAAYMWALLFMQAIGIQQDAGVELSTNTTTKFRSMWSTMLVLFSVITGGQDWYEFIVDFEEHGYVVPQYGLLFWIFFMLFGLVNVVVAVFCAQASEAQQANPELRVAKEKEQQAAKICELVQVFRKIDTEHSGYIVWEQFNEFANHGEAQMMLQAHGLKLFALEDFWHIMDASDGSRDGRVEMTTFVTTFMRLSGATMITDLMLLANNVNSLRADISEVFSELRNPTSYHIPQRRSTHDLHNTFTEHPNVHPSSEAVMIKVRL